jgi:hypothetical protein
MSTNALEIMRMPELFLGTSVAFETFSINSNGAFYAVVVQIEESCTISQLGFNITARTGAAANCRIVIRPVIASTGLLDNATILATTGDFDISTLTPNANGKMNYKTLSTPLAVTRGQIIGIVFQGQASMGGANIVTIARRIPNIYDGIGPRYRFPYVITTTEIKREGSWYGIISSVGKYYGFNPLSIKSNAADTAGRAYGNFFRCPAYGATIRCTGMKVVISETEATDNTIYELWSYNNITNSVSLLTSSTISSGITTNTAGYNKQIFFTDAVNMSPNEYYALTVRSSANSIDYKYLQFEDTGFIESMQSFGSISDASTYEQGGVEINTSTNVATPLGRLYLMNPLIDSISAGTTIGSFTTNFNSFNG